MIDQYVFVRLKKDCPDSLADIAAHTLEVLRSVPGVARVTVGTPADEHATAAWDLSIAVRFAELADVELYRNHPDHRRFVDQYLAPRMDVIKAWNFHISE